MSILEFEFKDETHGWSLTPTKFSDLNLLVGYSGAGKTRILNAIQAVRRGAFVGADPVAGCTWTIRVKTKEATYIWHTGVSQSRSLETPEQQTEASVNRPVFLVEEIALDTGEMLVQRTTDRFIFRGDELPKLNATESALSLLRDEESISPLREAFYRVVLSGTWISGVVAPSFERLLENASERYRTIGALREVGSFDLLTKALILQRHFEAAFKAIRDDYVDIFPSVTDIGIVQLSDSGVMYRQEGSDKPSKRLMFAIKEQGVDDWILADEISSGMLRTLTMLFELELAPPGTVVLIDEVENSLGVNCLSAVIDRVNRHSRDLQFILTSHHPYIINNIKPEHWRVVMRKGSDVTVKNGNDLPALQGRSSQDQFIRLINAQEFEDGLG